MFQSIDRSHLQKKFHGDLNASKCAIPLKEILIYYFCVVRNMVLELYYTKENTA